jgi:hypothetical protein
VTFTLGADGPTPAQIYRDPIMAIYELPNAAPYFEVQGAACQLQLRSRERLFATCDSPATLIRRELFYPGWRASVGGAETEILPYGEIMQQIRLPAGPSRVRFHYAPPYAGLCWAMTAAGLLGLLPLRRRA